MSEEPRRGDDLVPEQGVNEDAGEERAARRVTEEDKRGTTAAGDAADDERAG